MHIIVSTPIKESDNSWREAEDIKAAGGGTYFRKLARWPSQVNPGDFCFYLDQLAIRGYCAITEIVSGHRLCETTGRDWGEGYYLLMDATTWKWIEPIPIPAGGFRNFQYFDKHKYPEVKVVGGWLDLNPELATLQAGDGVDTLESDKRVPCSWGVVEFITPARDYVKVRKYYGSKTWLVDYKMSHIRKKQNQEQFKANMKQWRASHGQ